MMMIRPLLRTLQAGLALILMAAHHPLHAESTGPADGDDVISKAIEDYCTPVSDLAAERRAARQSAALKELESKVEQRLTLLEQRKQELAEYIRKRDELRNAAERELVDIYAGMEAEAAAAQMEKLDLRLSSSVLRQLKPRQASAILDVMKPELAANMVRLIASAAAAEKSRK